MIEGITKVKHKGRIGTVIMCRDNGEINLRMLDNYELCESVPRDKVSIIAEVVPSSGELVPKLGIWARILNFLMFWRRK